MMRSLLAILILAGAMAGCIDTSRARTQQALRSQESASADFARLQARARELAIQAERAASEGRVDAAIDLYRQALNTWSKLPSAYNNLGILLRLKGDDQSAAEAFSIASEQDPTDARPPYNLGSVYLDKGWPRRAAEYFHQALDRDPNYLPALRGAIRSADLLFLADDRTLEYIERATMMERDPAWAAYITRQRFRVEQQIERR
ncbi:MAG: tetratricopeptide repeat protein [Phycisphaeraceae bacterium]|nr:tetratricopeptide repeat protein [Phycisphaeraceae bacterium]MCW5754853.1 tetratricopeptide repeat protein [Phycisphaeraceae bacterium]